MSVYGIDDIHNMVFVMSFYGFDDVSIGIDNIHIWFAWCVCIWQRWYPYIVYNMSVHGIDDIHIWFTWCIWYRWYPNMVFVMSVYGFDDVSIWYIWCLYIVKIMSIYGLERVCIWLEDNCNMGLDVRKNCLWWFSSKKGADQTAWSAPLLFAYWKVYLDLLQAKFWFSS